MINTTLIRSVDLGHDQVAKREMLRQQCPAVSILHEHPFWLRGLNYLHRDNLFRAGQEPWLNRRDQ